MNVNLFTSYKNCFKLFSVNKKKSNSKKGKVVDKNIQNEWRQFKIAKTCLKRYCCNQWSVKLINLSKSVQWSSGQLLAK